MAWNHVNKSYPYVLRSTLQQTDEGLLYIPPTLTQPGAPGGATAQKLLGLTLRRFELHAIATGDVGIGFRWANSYWRAGQWTEATSAYTEDTVDAQDRDANDFALETTTVNDGFIILSTRPFSWVSIEVTTAGAGAAAAHAVRYSNSAGTGWTAVDGDSTFSDTFTNATNYAAGEIRFVWSPPSDWGKVTNIGTVPTGFYALNVRATDPSETTAALARAVEVGSMVAINAVAANGLYENAWSTFADSWADGLMAFFGASNGGDRVTAEVTTG